MVLLDSDEQIKIGSKIHDFKDLPGVDGKSHSLEDYKTKKVLVIIFMCNHCPYVQAIFDRIISIQKDYGDKGVQVIGINPNDAKTYPDDSLEAMTEKAPEQGVNFAYLRDDSQKVAKQFGALCTPDIFVYGEDRTLIYHGRVDDNWQEEEKITKKDLREALDKYLESAEIMEGQHPSMGCSIKWLREAGNV